MIKKILMMFLAVLLLLPTEAKSLMNTKKKNKVLIVVTSHDQLGDSGKKTGYWLAEVVHPFTVLKKAGYQIDIASPLGGKAPADPRSLKSTDSISEEFLKTKEWASELENTIKIDNVIPDDYSAILLAGGHGPMWDLPNNRKLNELIVSIYENGNIVGALCHGPAGLINAKLSNNKYLIAGKEVTSFTNEEEALEKLTKTVPFLLETELIKRGAKFKKVAPHQYNVIVSGRLATGQNPASAIGVGEEIVNLLNAKKLAGKY